MPPHYRTNSSARPLRRLEPGHSALRAVQCEVGGWGVGKHAHGLAREAHSRGRVVRFARCAVTGFRALHGARGRVRWATGGLTESSEKDIFDNIKGALSSALAVLPLFCVLLRDSIQA
jgi:hypothetical protein